MAILNVQDLEPQFASFRDYWLGWGHQERRDGNVTYYRSGLGDGQFNGILRVRTSQDVDSALTQARDALADVPHLWWIGADSGVGVGERLDELGFERVGTVPVMAVSLDRVTKVDGPAELKIEVVDGNEPLQEWVQSYWNSFGMDPALVSDAVRIEAARPDSSRIVRFIARAEGVPVGTALMRAAHGVAGIFVVSTSPEYRHRGIGAALTAAALEAGRQSGLHIGALQASASGAPLYTRMGFEKVAEYQLFSVSH